MKLFKNYRVKAIVYNNPIKQSKKGKPKTFKRVGKY